MRTAGPLLDLPTQDAFARLDRLVHQRDILLPPFCKVMAAWDPAPNDVDRETWARASLRLADVNAGPTALITFWQLCGQSAARVGVAALADVADAAANVCRHAGAQAARTVLEVRRQLADHLDAVPKGVARRWWATWERLAREAPECVCALAPHAGRILACAGIDGFAEFVAAGLRATGSRGIRERLIFFKLDDPRARRLLERLSGTVTFTHVRQRLRAFAIALWGGMPAIHAAQPHAEPMRRASFVGGAVRVPDVFPGVPSAVVERLFAATVAHATAHLALGAGRFDVGKLKPLQIVLIGLVEDARIEALAMRRFPGLRRLWAPFHVAEPSNVTTAPALLARLARALFDPAYRDPDGFVDKGRRLFAAERDFDDPGLSRRIGGLLGNDLGQMRIQFNARTYVVEPTYRDDGLGLWNFPPPAQTPPQETEIRVEAARSRTGESERRRHGEEAPSEAVGRARPVAADDRGIVVATYPEWDRASGTERADWTVVREVVPLLGDVQTLDLAVEREVGLRMRVERLVRGAKVGRRERLRRQPDGTDVDTDALIEAAVDLRLGDVPDGRVHRRSVPRMRDLAVSVLIDASASTGDRVAAAQGASVLEIEKLAVAVLASAMHALGDVFALHAFASNGHEDVRFVGLKEFDGRYDQEARARIAGLEPGLSTRLGTALRHAGTELSQVKATRKILLVLTDGAPSDIDVADPLDLIEDARRARLRLRRQGIDCFGIVLDPGDRGAGIAVFGRGNHLPVRRIEELPGRLAELYFRVARR